LPDLSRRQLNPNEYPIKVSNKESFKMKNRSLVLPVSILCILSTLIAACAAPAARPASVVQTVVVEKAVVVTPTPAGENPYRPTALFEVVEKLKEATAGKGVPVGARYAFVPNNLSPFWTAAQIGSARASAEINVPITFQAPTGPDFLSQQLSMLESFISDKYTGITFSAIDRTAPAPVIKKGIDQGITMLTMDSDATGSERALYIGMSDYDAGRAAAEAAKKIIGKGKVVGLVGFATAQNAQDRIQGVKDVFEGTELELVEVLLDDIKPEVALSNAQTAMQKYPDLAGFITFYSYDGPAAGQAIKQAGKTGQVKLVAFDAEPETQRLMQEGVVQAMIGQRVYFYGYLSGYVMHAMNLLGQDEVLNLLEPYRDGENKFRLNTGIDVIYADSYPQYKEYLNSIGIPSQ
jgi:ribose transport system substrate-binding protein